jgi:hypothetical protein
LFALHRVFASLGTIRKSHIMNKFTSFFVALALAGSCGPAFAQDKVDEPTTQELKKTDPVPPATGKNLPDQAGTQEPSAKVPGTNPNADVFVNGSLSVPGAAADTETSPSKFSARNAESDKLPIAAFRLKHLTDDQRRGIAQQIGKQRDLAIAPAGAASVYVVGAQVPATVALQELAPLPDELVAKLPELGGAGFMRTGGKLVLVDLVNRLVIGVLPAE